MSFASQAREEIAQHSLQLQKDCCVRAAAYGIACFAKYFDAKGLVLQTEQELTARVAEQLFARCGVRGTILEKSRPSGVASSMAAVIFLTVRGAASSTYKASQPVAPTQTSVCSGVSPARRNC